MNPITMMNTIENAVRALMGYPKGEVAIQRHGSANVLVISFGDEAKAVHARRAAATGDDHDDDWYGDAR